MVTCALRLLPICYAALMLTQSAALHLENSKLSCW